MLWTASRGVPGSSAGSSGTRSWPTSAHDATTGEISPETIILLSTHLVDAATLRRADFDAFFKHRRAALIDLISEAMGKPVIEDLTEAAELSEAASYEAEEDDISDDELVLVEATA